MPFAGQWCKVWIYFGFVFAWAKGARPRFDTSTDMGLVLVPADAEVDSVIFRLRATDQDADFPLVFEITGNYNEYHTDKGEINAFVKKIFYLFSYHHTCCKDRQPAVHVV